MTISLVKITTSKYVGCAISIAQRRDKYWLNRDCQKSQAADPNKDVIGEQKRVESGVSYLKIEVIQKMLSRFLVEKQMSQEELASALGITVRGLEQLFSQKDNSNLIRKINLPLIKLYCETKFL